MTKYTLTFGITRWEATQRVTASKLTRLTHKIAIQLHLGAESYTIYSSRSRRPVQKLLDTPSYNTASLTNVFYVRNFINIIYEKYASTSQFIFQHNIQERLFHRNSPPPPRSLACSVGHLLWRWWFQFFLKASVSPFHESQHFYQFDEVTTTLFKGC
jgi:hypothetical protein